MIGVEIDEGVYVAATVIPVLMRQYRQRMS